ncbi:MAG: tetratricopeptide repeat protein, partial [Armatimonadota bacterium]
PSVEALEWFSRGMLAYRVGYDEAGLHFTSALDVDDNFIEAHWMMGRVARAQRSPLVALEHLLRVTNAVPDSGQAHYYLASTLLSLGRQEEAIEEYKTARELSSNLRRSADAAIIRSYQRISQPDEAIAWGRKALAEGDEDSYILQAIGRVYQETGDYARAIEYYERAMGAATKRGATGWVWRSRQYMAESYEAMGRLDDAVQQLKLGIQAAGDRYGVPLRQALARVYERQGKVPEAIQEWQKVLQLSQPGTDPATEARERLERLRAR